MLEVRTLFHLFTCQVHKVKVETLQSIMTLVNSADGIAPFHLTTGNNGPISVSPVDNGKAGHHYHQHHHHHAGEHKSSVNWFRGVENESNLNDASSCFSTAGAGFTRLFQNNCLTTNKEEEGNEDGMSDVHKTAGVFSMEDEEGGDEERDDKTQEKVYSGRYRHTLLTYRS